MSILFLESINRIHNIADLGMNVNLLFSFTTCLIKCLRSICFVIHDFLNRFLILLHVYKIRCLYSCGGKRRSIHKFRIGCPCLEEFGINDSITIIDFMVEQESLPPGWNSGFERSNNKLQRNSVFNLIND
ncbi:hypothetical protein LXL04_038643 [Taraxacum kok-saghyz]